MLRSILVLSVFLIILAAPAMALTPSTMAVIANAFLGTGPGEDPGTLDDCGTCPLDMSSWQPGVPDGWVGPEDVAYLISIIPTGPIYFYIGPGDPGWNPCWDISSWNPGVPDGWIGPEDVAYLIEAIDEWPSYYRQCPFGPGDIVVE